jgi:hypothetical protein
VMGDDAHGLDIIGEPLIGEAEEAAPHRPQAPSPLMMMDDVGRDVEALRRREVEGGLVDRRFLETLELCMVGSASAGRPRRSLSRSGEG